jgi:hypothetical protein
VFKALASPFTHEPILAAPQRLEAGSPLAYWSALLNLLIHSFGWARPDRGLRWWYDAGKPTDDPRLQLLSQVWDADRQLDWFAAWLWTTPSIFEAEGVRCALSGLGRVSGVCRGSGRYGGLQVCRLGIDGRHLSP